MGITIKDCPTCDGEGHVHEFTAAEFDSIGAHHPEVVEMPCTSCGARMDVEKSEWTCRFCGDTDDLAKDSLVETLSGDGYDTPGMPGILSGECPKCGDENSVQGGPDGEVICNSCEFYAGQYSAEWYAYAAWLAGNKRVEIQQ